MIFQSFFKSIVDREVTIKVELKNGLIVSGTLNNVDQNMNFFLHNISVENPS
jgi:small nuclear ribonucleoprotein (snRNP)-like protein